MLHSSASGLTAGKISLMFFGGITVGRISKLFGWKKSEIGVFSHDLNLSHPRSISIAFNKVYAFIARLTVLAYWPIRLILGVIRFSKVRKFIIRCFPINMVNLLRWKRACHVQPGESVRFMSPSGYSYPQITFRIGRPSNIASLCSVSDRNNSSKNPGIRTIVKNGFQVFLCQLHDAPRMRIGVSGAVASNYRSAILTHQTLNDSYGGYLAA